jgi:hypothetical protein
MALKAKQQKRTQCASRISYSGGMGGGGIYPRHEFDIWGCPPQSIWVFLKMFFWFWKFNTFKCNFKAFRSRIKHFQVLETHQGVISNLVPPQIHFWRKPCVSWPETNARFSTLGEMCSNFWLVTAECASAQNQNIRQEYQFSLLMSHTPNIAMGYQFA